MNHIQLICDIGELNEVFTDTQNINDFLQKIVEMVAKHMDAAVCSVYLFDEDRNELVLKATKGLSHEAVDKVRMKLGEGLVGLSLKQLRPIYERKSSAHPSYKYFPDTLEEKYEAFVAVPIVRGLSRIGVLVIQRQRRRIFKEQEIVTLRAVASQLANMLENARLFMSLRVPRYHEEKKVRPLKLAKGNVASEGYALGPARIIDRDRVFESFLHREYKKKYTLEDFNKALSVTEKQLEDLQAIVEEKLSDVASLIFTAHLLLLKDTEFVGAMAQKIEDGMNAPNAVLSVAKRYVDLFSHGENHYIREKVQDIEDLTIRVMGNLVKELSELYRCNDHIVIARELYPSDMLKLSSEGVLGVVLVTGGVTSHLSILARSLNVPMVIIDSPRLLSIPDETKLLLDAEIGNLHVNPSATVTANFHSRNEARKKISIKRMTVKPKTYTKDGQQIRLMASINLLSDLKVAKEVKCEGIGLYRTEFPFLIRSNFPSEEEQYVVYRQLVEGLPGKEVAFRTLDIGGDKVLSYYDMTMEQNPFLGMRSIRFSLSNREIFLQQIRAMLRAGFDTDIRITFPMISSLEEFLEARNAVIESIGYLREKKIPHNSNPLIGIMVEVPSIVDMAQDLARVADFFSIGSNDLVQYMLAVDRTNEKVASFYIPHHPSILRAIKRITDAAASENKEVMVCGDMAHQEKYLPFFIGTGIKTLSLEAAYIPKIQEAIGKVDSLKAQNLAAEVLSTSKISEITKLLK
ncbi:phosphoenolpyruvate--protein phosphotransferase [Chitinispirillales bacterium ANBcel5]|uniref:phosphoenolpyruvate--protein phosphotransferase n=1 Tax=Cellulosispirillum alkaliphilum TaxID=3039283 RepID=UPI002A570D12|nr:phosphoenolpyruvate--protein phosphotransferase [Chitinispirillales bacterium ANBcel5]